MILGILDFQILFIKRICKNKKTIRKSAVFLTTFVKIKWRYEKVFWTTWVVMRIGTTDLLLVWIVRLLMRSATSTWKIKTTRNTGGVRFTPSKNKSKYMVKWVLFLGCDFQGNWGLTVSLTIWCRKISCKERSP